MKIIRFIKNCLGLVWSNLVIVGFVTILVFSIFGFNSDTNNRSVPLSILSNTEAVGLLGKSMALDKIVEISKHPTINQFEFLVKNLVQSKIDQENYFKQALRKKTKLETFKKKNHIKNKNLSEFPKLIKSQFYNLTQDYHEAVFQFWQATQLYWYLENQIQALVKNISINEKEIFFQDLIKILKTSNFSDSDQTIRIVKEQAIWIKELLKD